MNTIVRRSIREGKSRALTSWWTLTREGGVSWAFREEDHSSSPTSAWKDDRRWMTNNIESTGGDRKEVDKDEGNRGQPAGGESALLRAVRAADFHPHLNMLKQYRRVIPYDELLKEFDLALPYSSREDAVAVCNALAASGCVVRSGDIVYLHPDEIAKSLRTILPGDLKSLESRLRSVKKQLEPMEAVKEEIRQQSHKRTTTLNYSFFALMAAQWLVFFRLCYWDLSWDIVEPIGFFANGLTTILSFGWFLRTRRDFTYQEMANTVMSNYEVGSGFHGLLFCGGENL